jgi:hypothetical protein
MFNAQELLARLRNEQNELHDSLPPSFADEDFEQQNLDAFVAQQPAGGEYGGGSLFDHAHAQFADDGIADPRALGSPGVRIDPVTGEEVVLPNFSQLAVDSPPQPPTAPSQSQPSAQAVSSPHVFEKMHEQEAEIARLRKREIEVRRTPQLHSPQLRAPPRPLSQQSRALG